MDFVICFCSKYPGPKCTTMQFHMFMQQGGSKLRTIFGSGGKTRLWKRRQVHVELMIHIKAYYDDIYICQNTRQVPALLDDHHVDLDDVHSHHDSLLASLHSHRIWHQRLQWIITTLMLDRTRIFKRQQFSIKQYQPALTLYVHYKVCLYSNHVI